MEHRKIVSDCGGCLGLGSHTRWCPKIVGEKAWRLGLASETVESMADQIGSLDPYAANLIYRAASVLKEKAVEESQIWKDGDRDWV